LPTYPFERQRYWIESQALAEGSQHRPQSNKKLGIDDWFYIPVWKQSAPPLSSVPDAPAATEWWFVFANNDDSHTEILEKLKQENEHIVAIFPGQHFSQPHQDMYTINPHTRADYETLISTLRQRDQHPGKLIHLWSAGTHAEQTDVERFDQIQKFGFYSLLFLVQALGEQNITDPMQLVVVSTNLHDVNGDEELDPAKSTILGPCKVIPLEYPHITCRNIDVVMSDARGARSGMAGQLAAEINSAATDEVVAYRGRRRWVQTFDSAQLPPEDKKPSILRQNGTYLITGGLGGAGLVIARYLARSVQPNLILTGRTGLPDRSTWSQWLDERDEQDAEKSATFVTVAVAAGAEPLPDDGVMHRRGTRSADQALGIPLKRM
jgi:acyl transferase domain-containing protein